MEKGKFYDIIAIGALAIGIIGVVLLPAFLIKPAFLPFFKLAPKEDIGSLIGGTTAPLIGLVTASLMYIAFKAQYLANKKQWEKIESVDRLEILSRLISDLQEDLKFHNVYDKLRKKESFKEFGKDFNENTAFILKILLHDLILIQSSLLNSNKIISNENAMILRFKIEGFWDIISKIYHFTDAHYKDDKLIDYYSRSAEYNDKIAKTFF